MPRTGPRRIVLLLSFFLAALVTAPFLGALGASASASPVPHRADGGIIGGINVDQAVADLQDDGVAVISSSTSVSSLASIVADAKRKGLAFGVLATGVNMSETDCSRLAQTLSNATHLTVLVLTPGPGHAISPVLSASVLQDAQKAAAAAGLNDVAATQAFVGVATQKSSGPWVTIGIIAAVILLGGGFLLWSRRRRTAAAEHQRDDLTAGLKDRWSKLAPQILGLSARVEVLGRPDLEARFDQASSDYSTLQPIFAAPIADQAVLDSTTATVADLEQRLGALDAEVDALAPGIEPPSPAG